MDAIRKIAIVANFTKPDAAELVEALSRAAADVGVAVAVPEEYPLRTGALDGCDICVTLGGDGTLLGAVGEAARGDIPVLGINRGKLGFLTHYPAENAAESLGAVLRGEFQFSTRTLLECDTCDGCHAYALNDVVVAPDGHASLAKLRASVSGEFVNSFWGDGLVVATPTGSTAYNLSAGGPLIDPAADVFAITPICPHSFSNRALILPRGRVLTIAAEDSANPLRVEVDGVHFHPDKGNMPLTVWLSERKLRLAQPVGFRHFSLLRSKLRWL
ncbi:MAG: NAD(+)/NADH kinase [Puniceicoccales bacterium]|jgi:NAD+ kinase|nr:NAD(+)/NADH kinase [Puniceicoccales bacterium]